MMNAITSAADAKVRAGDPYPVQVEYLGERREVRGDRITLDVLEGSELTLTLPENSGSTGYRWGVSMDEATAEHLEVVRDETLVPRCGTPPTGGSLRRLTFRVGDGAATPLRFTLELARPWGETVPPAARKDVTLKVYSNSPVEPYGPGILPGGCIPPDSLEEARRVKAAYGDAIATLPGTTGHGVGADGSLRIYTRSAEDSRKLDNLLEDRIEGVPVRFVETGVIRPRAAVQEGSMLVDPDRVLRSYGEALAGLPGVLHVGLQNEKLGPMLPAFQEVLVVDVASPQDARRLDNLLEDQVEGVPVRITATPWMPRPIG